MQGKFQVAGGSVTGRDHVVAGKNSHDAYVLRSCDLATLVVVCDGCSSGKHSEVGAKLGARLISDAILRKINVFHEVALDASFPFWEEIRQEVLGYFRAEVELIGQGASRTSVVENYFLFTVLGALVTPWGTMTFSIGDGVIIVNGKLTQLGPFPNNAPPYLLYGLSGSTHAEAGADEFQFNVQRILPGTAIDSILIGSDGCGDFINAANRHMPGSEIRVGAIDQFWLEDRYFRNADMIRRKLCLTNKDSLKIHWASQTVEKQPGLLPDDTTVTVIRRLAKDGEE